MILMVCCWYAFLGFLYAVLLNSLDGITKRAQQFMIYRLSILVIMMIYNQAAESFVSIEGLLNHTTETKELINHSKQSELTETAKAEFLETANADLLKNAKASFLKIQKLSFSRVYKPSFLRL